MVKLKSVGKARIVGIAAVSTVAVALTGCGRTFTGDDTKNIEISTGEYQNFYKHTAEVYKNYVTLGDYTNISYEKVDRSNETATDDEVNTAINSLLSQTATTKKTTNGTTKDGDSVNIDYTGTIDGTEFAGGSAKDTDYTIGSGQFIDDLDKGLANLEVGKEYDINVKFPDDYSSSDLAGKNATFKVKVNYISTTETPELTDTWVKRNSRLIKNSGYGDNAQTVDKLKENVKQALIEAKVRSNNSNDFANAYTVIKEASTINGYPESELNYLVDTYKSNVRQQYDNYGQSSGAESYADFLQQQYEMSEDEFNNYVTTEAKTYLDEKMIITLIADAADIEVTANDINEQGSSLAAYYGYNSYSDILKQFGNIINCEMGYNVLYYKVGDYVTNPNSKEGNKADNYVKETKQGETAVTESAAS